MLARPSTSPTVAGAAQRAAVARPNRSRCPVRALRRVAGREYDQPRLEYTRVCREAGRSWPCVGAMSRGGHKQVGRASATTPLYRVRPALVRLPAGHEAYQDRACMTSSVASRIGHAVRPSSSLKARPNKPTAPPSKLASALRLFLRNSADVPVPGGWYPRARRLLTAVGPGQQVL